MIIETWFLLSLGSAFFSAGAAVSQKKVLFKTEVLTFSFLLFIFVLLFSLPALFCADFSGVSTGALIALYIRSLLGTFSFLFVMLSIKNMEISRALPLLALTPGLVAIFAFLFLGDKLTITETGGLSLLVAGTYILEVKSRGGIFEPFKVFIKSRSHNYILAALLLFTVTAVADRALLGRYKFQEDTYYLAQQAFYLFNFTMIVAITGGLKRNLSKLKEPGLAGWLIVIALITVGYRYTEISAIKIAPVALVLSVKRISIFIAMIVGGKLFKEKDLLKKIIAAVIIIGGSLLITM